MKKWIKRALWIGLGLVLLAFLARSFRETPVLVDVAVVQSGTLLVTADDDGRTRIRERYTVSAPIAGRLLRTALDPGDAVAAGETLVAELAPVASGLLDARTRSEAGARIRRSEAALQEAETRVEMAEADHVFAEAELERFRSLHQQGVQARETLERMERDERLAFQGVRAAQFAVQVAGFELEVARASLLEPSGEGPTVPGTSPVDGDGGVALAPDGRLLLRSPVDGRVLRVFEESARTLPAGTPILEIGADGAIEVVADYLSQEAVRIEPGMEALLEGWGGVDDAGEEVTLHGRVRLVEPGGFTKVSALGVEEQRVNVVVDPDGDPADWSALGDGYRVELRILLWRGDDVLIVPTGALFREGAAWAVFVVEEGRAVRREVQLGRMNGLEAQVLGGLSEGDRVVLYPSELIGEGAAVEAR